MRQAWQQQQQQESPWSKASSAGRGVHGGLQAEQRGHQAAYRGMSAAASPTSYRGFGSAQQQPQASIAADAGRFGHGAASEGIAAGAAAALDDLGLVGSSNEDDGGDDDADMQSMRASVQAAQVAADEAEAALRRSFGALARGVVEVGGKRRGEAGHGSPAGRSKLERAAALVEDVEDMYRKGEGLGAGDQDVCPMKPWRVRDRMFWREAAGAAAAAATAGGGSGGVGRYDATNQGRWQHHSHQQQQQVCTSDLISNLASRYSEAQSFLRSFKDSGSGRI